MAVAAAALTASAGVFALARATPSPPSRRSSPSSFTEPPATPPMPSTSTARRQPRSSTSGRRGPRCRTGPRQALLAASTSRANGATTKQVIQAFTVGNYTYRRCY